VHRSRPHQRLDTVKAAMIAGIPIFARGRVLDPFGNYFEFMKLVVR
jgi:hypothetical protein